MLVKMLDSGMDVARLPKNRTVFTVMRDIRFPANGQEIWIQEGRVTPAIKLTRGLPACSLRNTESARARGGLLARGTRLPMPDRVITRGPLTFRAIPIERARGLVLDCARSVEYNFMNRPYLNGNPSEGGRMTVSELRSAITGTINVVMRQAPASRSLTSRLQEYF
jgi:hypothetical protein